ncbi:4-alpha-glucanotransferase [uncultured Cohaesibacter sp.]|uniref:4-alpha-glucanotransferase n=1 Tax=uncultured Cohaesibacter sp. TaxID=1002546 RepID=UPI00292CB160|nr:4-alpha-glucanotransferase [uncultured Cohaesibacter sp.]
MAETHITLPPITAPVSHDLVCEVGGRRSKPSPSLQRPLKAPSIASICGKERIWGLNAALYGIRSKRNSGLGDFEDLARLSEFVRELGGSFVGINPVHTLGFSDPYANQSLIHPAIAGSSILSTFALDKIPGLEKLPEARSLLQAVETQWTELRASEEGRVFQTSALAIMQRCATSYTLFLQHASSYDRQQLDQFRTGLWQLPRTVCPGRSIDGALWPRLAPMA